MLWQRALAEPRIYFVIPLVVLEELDALKTSTRMEGSETVGALARQASRWVLRTVQQQKYETRAGSLRLEPTQWVVHVQTVWSRDAAARHEVRDAFHQDQ